MSKNRRITDLEVRIANLEHARRNLLLSVESNDRAVAALEDQIADLEYAERTRLKSDPHTQQCQSDRSDPVGQSADLRTRIADALRAMTGNNASGDPITYQGMADAVIRELNLTETDRNIIGPNHLEEQ